MSVRQLDESTELVGDGATDPDEESLRQIAIDRLEKKQDFRTHVFVYMVVNLGLWTLWIIDSIRGSWEFPWPVFPTFFWGLFVLGQAHDLFRRDPMSEERVRREMDRMRGG